MERLIMNGNHAAAYGALLSRVQVTASYPISPQTGIVEKLAEFVASGRMPAKYIQSESEHSVMAAMIAASEVGARTFTATSSQGLALMHELLHWASGARLPIVMVNVNRVMAAPWSMYCDLSDSLAQRDTGWLHLYCEDNQDVLDSVIQGYKIAEQVLVPIMINAEGFYISYTTEQVDVHDAEKVDAYLPPWKPTTRIDPDDPHTLHGGTDPSMFMEMRYLQSQAMDRVLSLAEEEGAAFGRLFGRSYGLIDAYRCEDADLVLVTAGTIMGTLREVVDDYRARGEKVGALKIRYLRPFPVAALRKALAPCKRVAVLDRDVSLGMGGVFCQELRAALHGVPEGNKPVVSFLAGIGGRDVTPRSVDKVIEIARSERPPLEPVWLDLKN